jgi:hypothetical protein
MGNFIVPGRMVAENNGVGVEWGGGGLCFNCGRTERNKYAPLSPLMDYAPLRRSGTERKGLLTLFLEVVCIVHGIIYVIDVPAKTSVGPGPTICKIPLEVDPAICSTTIHNRWDYGLYNNRRKRVPIFFPLFWLSALFCYRLVWAKKVSLAAICLDISSACFGILFFYCRTYHIPLPL